MPKDKMLKIVVGLDVIVLNVEFFLSISQKMSNSIKLVTIAMN